MTSAQTGDDEGWLDQFDVFEKALIVFAGAYVAHGTVRSGDNHPMFALLIAFPGFVFIFGAWYLFLKMIILTALGDDEGGRFFSKVAEAASLGVVGVMVEGWMS